MLGAVRDQGTDERAGVGRARKCVRGGVGGAGDVTELDFEGLDVGKPTNHARGKVGRCFPAAERDVVSECDDGLLPLSSVSTYEGR